jgi:hypothetical protein
VRKDALQATLLLLCALIAAAALTPLTPLYLPFGTARDTPLDPRRPMPAPAAMDRYAGPAAIRTGATTPSSA